MKLFPVVAKDEIQGGLCFSLIDYCIQEVGVGGYNVLGDGEGYEGGQEEENKDPEIPPYDVMFHEHAVLE